ncbi:outer membrane protein [Beijerinckia sp. L45]|uniref:outer membrane protein n=1 Tax=Beijerinckia sp. L45 TaxID=1641855 RepID=UPI00131DA111|nr:outer membrane protein [Beijerinckia sp. L45]
MIRKLLLSSVALAALSGTAFAADLPSRRAPPVYAPPPIPVFSWTGFYIGGQVGYGFGRDNAGIVATGPFSSSPNGIIGGGHVGYNFSTQSLPLFGGVFGTGGVIGVEGDVDGSDYRRTVALAGPDAAVIRNNIQGSIRGRLGFAVDRALFYATGGAAFADFRTNYTTFLGGNDSLSHTRVGWTVGGGVEYAVTNNWSLRAEYRYSDFGSFTDLSPAFFSAVRHHETEQRAQVGFSYKFDTPAVLAPVVARY